MDMYLTDKEIQDLLIGPNRDLHLVGIIKNWRLLSDKEQHDLVHLMSKYVLRHELGDQKDGD